MQQAVSKLMLDTPSLGEVAFYLLHGSAENTPLPLGARDLCQRQALIAYKGEYMAHKNALGEWRASPLTSLRSGHLALHLFERSVSPSTLVKPPERPDHGRGDRRDGEGDDHEDRHRDGGGDGGGDHGRPKRTRSEATVRSDQRTSQPSGLVNAAVLATADGTLARNQLFPSTLAPLMASHAAQ